jgi:hypothetical protein
MQMIRAGIIALLLCGLFGQAASAGHPAEAHQMQDAVWQVLAGCRVDFDKKTSLYTIDYTKAFRELEGTAVTIIGFMIPLESSINFEHFLLSRRALTCPFCPPGEPNEIVEVYTRKPIKWSGDRVIINGVIRTAHKSEQGVFFQIKDHDTMSTRPEFLD